MPAPSAGNLVILKCCNFGIEFETKKKCSNALGHNRSEVSGTWAATESIHTNFSRFRKSNGRGWLGYLKCSSCSQTREHNIFFKALLVCRILGTWEGTVFPNIYVVMGLEKKLLNSGLG